MTEDRAAYLSDYWTTDDHLDFSDFRPALFNILTEAQTPLTVGVFGPWGSGKTSLLRMLKEKVEEEKRSPSLRAVWFTAWKYDRHEALWRVFILRVLDALYPRKEGDEPWEKRERLKDLQGEQKEQVEKLQRLEQSVYRPVDWEELGRWTMDWWQAVRAGGEAAADIAAALVPGAALFKDALTKVLKGEGEPDILNREIQAYHREQLTSMEQFEATFKDALTEVLGEDGRLIIFVDDLDRCLPEKAVEVLEAIKLFLEVEGTAFMLGMDRTVIERGIEARYGACFQGDERPELPIDGASYLQKIVQIPFHLPPLAVDDVGEYIEALEEKVPADVHLGDMTRDVFAHGLLPNPRQAKRALNIFRLLKDIAQTRGMEDDVTWPLLAKTVLIQTQWSELYSDWRQYPTLVQTLEAEYARQPFSDKEAIRGRPAMPEEEAEESSEAGGLLEPYLGDRRKYALLERMLAFPRPDEGGEGQERARFEGLGREQMAAYVRLAGAVGTEEQVALEIPADLLTEMLSGDRAKIRDAIGRLEEEEPERIGARRDEIREQLQQVMRDPACPAKERVSAGDALALVGDPRFREDVWYLPDEPLLGFVEISEGPFLMGEGDDQHELSLPTYYVARYPVTVAQFRAFVEDSDFQPENADSLRGVDNHPVVQVSWHEALAYCEWLTQRLRTWEGTPEPLATLLREEDWIVTLPSEAEWEKTARGALEMKEGLTVGGPGGLRIAFQGENPSPDRRYPWGDKADPERANCDDTGIGATNAVGCFLGGVSPYGVEELSGNVWEWTRSLYEQWRRARKYEGSR